MIKTFSKDQPVWWEPEDKPWRTMFPKRRAMACNVISVNEHLGTALVEYMDATRRTHRALAHLVDLRPRALPR